MSVEQFIEAFNMRSPPAPAVALPVVTFAHSVSFHLNGDEIRAIHMPSAHTDGDAVVHFLNNDVVHMGDIYFNGMYPLHRRRDRRFRRGRDRRLRQDRRHRERQDEGDPGPRTALEQGGAQGLSRHAGDGFGPREGHDPQGKKLEDITASDITKDLDEKWGKGFIKGPKFVEMLAKAQLKR
jgi:hypothetical protein